MKDYLVKKYLVKLLLNKNTDVVTLNYLYISSILLLVASSLITQK